MAHVLNTAKLTCIDELFKSTGEDIKTELSSDVAEVDVEELLSLRIILFEYLMMRI